MKSKAVNRILLVSICVTIAVGIATHYGYLKRRESEQWVAHTHKVITRSHQLLSNTMDAESSQRSYLLTADTNYLPPYRLSLQLTESLMDTVSYLVRDNPSQSKLFADRIRPLNAGKVVEWEHTMDLLATKGRDAAVRYLNDQHGNSLLDSIWTNTKQFIRIEEDLLVQREHVVESFNWINNVLRYGGFFFVAIASAIALVTIRGQQKSNLALLQELFGLNAELEGKVKERTSDLEVSNRQLFDSNEEMRALHDSLKIRNRHVEESLQEVRDLYDNAPCGYHTIDRNGIVVRMNQTELDWLGYRMEEVIGKMHVSELVAGSLAQRDANMKKLVVVGHLENIEFDMVRKNGTRFSVLINTAAMYDSKGNFVRNRSTVFDISQRKNLEQKLRDVNEHLVKLNDEKNRFIGMATHDLKNPLNALTGLLHLFRTEKDLSPGQLEYLQFMEESVTRMKNLISKLLDLNRIEQSRTIVQKAKVNLSTFLERIIAGYQEAAGKKSIELILENPLGELSIETDPTLFEQVIDNFLSNAIKFSEKGKKVWLRSSKSATDLVIEIEDQGPGISAEELPRLFGTFQRLSAQPTGGETSSGLGLSIAKELVRTLGGEVKVESEVGKGTKFEFVVKI